MRRFARTHIKKQAEHLPAALLGLRGIQRTKVTEGLEKILHQLKLLAQLPGTIKKMYEIHYENVLDFSKCNVSFPYSVD